MKCAALGFCWMLGLQARETSSSRPHVLARRVRRSRNTSGSSSGSSTPVNKPDIVAPTNTLITNSCGNECYLALFRLLSLVPGINKQAVDKISVSFLVARDDMCAQHPSKQLIIS